MDTNNVPGPCGDQPVQTPGNRKVPRTDLWKRNIRRTKRARGESYVNMKGHLVAARQCGLPCGCKNGCFSRVDTIKEQILVSFNKLADKTLQDTHLSSLITSNSPKRRRIRSEPCKAARMSSNKYHIRNGVHRIPVCRKAFAALHGVTIGRVALLVKKLNCNAPIKDTRGIHTNRANRIPQEVVKEVHDHIDSFPCDQSHYSRADNMEWQCLSPQLSIKKMHELFVENHPLTPGLSGLLF